MLIAVCLVTLVVLVVVAALVATADAYRRQDEDEHY